MSYVLDCITLFLNVYLCAYLLYDNYSLRKEHMVRRIALVAVVVIVKALIMFFQISLLNFITGFCMCVDHSSVIQLQ